MANQVIFLNTFSNQHFSINLPQFLVVVYELIVILRERLRIHGEQISEEERNLLNRIKKLEDAFCEINFIEEFRHHALCGMYGNKLSLFLKLWFNASKYLLNTYNSFRSKIINNCTIMFDNCHLLSITANNFMKNSEVVYQFYNFTYTPENILFINFSSNSNKRKYCTNYIINNTNTLSKHEVNNHLLSSNVSESNGFSSICQGNSDLNSSRHLVATRNKSLINLLMIFGCGMLSALTFIMLFVYKKYSREIGLTNSV